MGYAIFVYICYAPWLWLFPPQVYAVPEPPPVIITGPGMIEPKPTGITFYGDDGTSGSLWE